MHNMQCLLICLKRRFIEKKLTETELMNLKITKNARDNREKDAKIKGT